MQTWLASAPTGAVLLTIVATGWVRLCAVLLVAQFLTGVLAAIKDPRQHFTLGALGEWMAPVCLLLGGGAIFQLLAWGLPPEYEQAGGAGAAAIWLIIAGTVVGRILKNVSDLTGLALPTLITDRAARSRVAVPLSPDSAPATVQLEALEPPPARTRA